MPGPMPEVFDAAPHMAVAESRAETEEPAPVPEIVDALPHQVVVESQAPVVMESQAPVVVESQGPVLVPVASLPLPVVAPATDPSAQRRVLGWTASRDAVADGATPTTPEQSPVRLRIEPFHPDSVVEVSNVSASRSSWAPTVPERRALADSSELLRLIDRLNSSDQTTCKDALVELADLGDSAAPAADAVRPLLQHESPVIRAHASWTLLQIDEAPAESLRTLAEVLREDNPRAATLAAYCLGLLETDARTAIPDLQSACGSSDPSVQLCAAEALLRVTPASAEPIAILLDVLQETDRKHRWLAALAMSSVGSDHQETAIAALIPLLQDADPDVAASAALALGAYGPSAVLAEPGLRDLARDSNPELRDAAAAALACIAE